jgi:uncharacterized protein (DUF2147 family)
MPEAWLFLLFSGFILPQNMPMGRTSKHLKISLFLSLLLICATANAQVAGKWKTIDDETGDQKSIVEIFERDGKLYGRIVKLFRKPGEDQDPVCDECEKEDPRYGKKIIGMEIIREMTAAENEYSGGDILDPNNGKVYRCRIWRDGEDLMVRGYWGPFYRTQKWLKAQ